MGKGSGGSAPTSSTVTQSNMPDYAAPYFQQLMGQGLSQMATPYQQYQGQQVANTSPFQQAAQGALANMQGVPDATNTSGQIDTNIANQAAGFNPQFSVNQINPQSVQAGQTSVQNWTDPGLAQQYMSPYTQNVLDAQKANMNVDYQNSLNQVNSQATQAGAFGGDRQAVQDAALNRTYQQQLQQMESTGLNNAYNQGQQTFLGNQAQSLQSQQANQNAGLQGQISNQNANLQGQSLNNQYGLQAQNFGAQYGIAGMQAGLSAANQLGNIGNQQQNQGLNYINALNSMGQGQQQQQQNLLNTSYNNFGQAQNWNWQQLGNYGNLLHGVPVSPNYTQTNLQAAPSLGGMLGGLGSIAAGGLSGGATK